MHLLECLSEHGSESGKLRVRVYCSGGSGIRRIGLFGHGCGFEHDFFFGDVSAEATCNASRPARENGALGAREERVLPGVGARNLREF